MHIKVRHSSENPCIPALKLMIEEIAVLHRAKEADHPDDASGQLEFRGHKTFDKTAEEGNPYVDPAGHSSERQYWLAPVQKHCGQCNPG